MNVLHGAVQWTTRKRNASIERYITYNERGRSISIVGEISLVCRVHWRRLLLVGCGTMLILLAQHLISAFHLGASGAAGETRVTVVSINHLINSSSSSSSSSDWQRDGQLRKLIYMYSTAGRPDVTSRDTDSSACCIVPYPSRLAAAGLLASHGRPETRDRHRRKFSRRGPVERRGVGTSPQRRRWVTNRSSVCCGGGDDQRMDGAEITWTRCYWRWIH